MKTSHGRGFLPLRVSSVPLVGGQPSLGSANFGQVKHQKTVYESELLGDLSVTVMFRTALFPHCRSRCRNTTPAPPLLFEKLSESFLSSLATLTFELPSLAACEKSLGQQALAVVASDPSISNQEILESKDVMNSSGTVVLGTPPAKPLRSLRSGSLASKGQRGLARRQRSTSLRSGASAQKEPRALAKRRR